MISTGIHNDSTNINLFSVNNSNNHSPSLLNKNNRLGITFSGNYMKQNKLGYAHGTSINIYIVYQLKNKTIDNADFTVLNGLFGAVKLTKNSDTSKYGYSGYGICFDSSGSFTSGNITNGSIHSTNKTQNIYVLGKSFIQEINGTTIYAESIYKTNFTQHSKKFVL